MGRDQFTLRSLSLAVFWSAVGLALARFAFTLEDNGTIGILVCCAAGSAFGIANYQITRHRYRSALIGFLAGACVTALTLPAVVM